MSDGKEVRRWEIYNLCVLGEPMSAVVAGPFTDPKVRAVEVMAVEDHDRIMSERDELWKRATKFVMPGEMDTGESIEHYIKTLEQTIATQARVIEKLNSALEECETLVDTDPITTTNEQEEIGSWVNADHLREIVQTALADVAAIEKEGAKDES